MTFHHKTLFSLLSVFLLTPLLALAKEPQPPAALPIEQMRAAVYTKDFAKRFALPDPEPGTEPSGGVQAMEFAVEENPNAPYYYCKLYLYLDNKLPIAYPEGDTGIAYLPSRRTQLMTFDAQTRWLRLSEKDRLHFNERKSRYWQLANWATPDYRYQQQGASTNIFIDEYYRNLFPGLSYVKLDSGCLAYSWVDKVEMIQIWLKREGGKDYRYEMRTDPADFMKFDVPNTFWRQIRHWMKQVAEYNRPILEQQNKKYPNPDDVYRGETK